jgi:1,4-dihydroxy-2-naphthoate octaprenyltransferase
MSIAEERVSTIVNQSPSQRQLWYAAIKPPMYTVAVIPITFGTALAYRETGLFNLNVYLTFLLSAILIIAWLNLTNDVFDANTGIDVNKAHSIVNLTGNQRLIFWIANIFLIFGLIGIVLINYWQNDWTVFGVILACCFLGYTYQGPPFRLGYLGLGEIICFFTFGPMAIAATYYSQSQDFSLNSLWASILIGISTSIILFCSHFHQIKDDILAGKKSPIVRLGTKKSAQVLTLSVILFFLVTIILILIGTLPLTTSIVILSFPIAIQLITLVRANHNQPEQIKNSKFIAVNLHFVSGLLLSLGLILKLSW